MEKQESKWLLLIKFINTSLSMVKRKDIFEALGENPRSSSSSLDTYRRLLSRCGYISDKTPYLIFRRIPTDLTLRQAIKEAYSEKAKAIRKSNNKIQTEGLVSNV